MVRLSEHHKNLLRQLVGDGRKYAGKQFKRYANQGLSHAKKWAMTKGVPMAEKYAREYALPMAERMITGVGDYHTRHGTKGYAHSKRGFTPRASRSHHTARRTLEKGEMVIKHSEYIGELLAPAAGSSSTVASAGAFTAQVYGINPGNSSTFPWLSSTANNFQEYEIVKLVYEYRALTSESTSSSSGSLVGMGSVIMATQYDSSRPAYASKQAMEESDFAKSVKPSQSLLHAIECKKGSNPLSDLYINAALGFTSSPVVPTGTPAGQQAVSGSDIRMQNMGFFQIACQGIPNTNVGPLDIGEIWCHYEVKLKRPLLNSYQGALLSSHYSFVNNSTVLPGKPFGTGVSPPIQQAGSLLPLTFTYGSTTSTFVFPSNLTQGNYMCCLGFQSSTGFVIVANTSINIPIVTNGTILQMWVGDTQKDVYAPYVSTSNATVETLSIFFVISINAPGGSACSVEIDLTTWCSAVGGGANTNFDLSVSPYNTNIST